MASASVEINADFVSALVERLNKLMAGSAVITRAGRDVPGGSAK